jgi:hypothetical protein
LEVVMLQTAFSFVTISWCISCCQLSGSNTAFQVDTSIYKTIITQVPYTIAYTIRIESSGGYPPTCSLAEVAMPRGCTHVWIGIVSRCGSQVSTELDSFGKTVVTGRKYFPIYIYNTVTKNLTFHRILFQPNMHRKRASFD